MISDSKFKHLMTLNCYKNLVRSYIILTIPSGGIYMNGNEHSGPVISLIPKKFSTLS